MSHFYNVMNELRRRVSTLEKKLTNRKDFNVPSILGTTKLRATAYQNSVGLWNAEFARRTRKAGF